MTEKETRLLTAAIDTVARHGLRRTTMSDIAEAAQVSRQTLYTSFASKDEVMVAAIAFFTDRILTEIRAAWATEPTLAGRYDIYVEKAVREPFELLRSMPDIVDLITGGNPVARAAVVAADDEKRAALLDLFADHAGAIAAQGQSVADLATFVQRTTAGFKTTARDTADLNRLLATLKVAVLAIAAPAEVLV